MLEVNLNNENFEVEVIKSDKPVLVDFWATWCGPCKMIAPVLAEFAEEHKDKIKIGKVNVDEQSELSSKYKISSIPTLMLFEKGQIINVIVGYHSKEELEKMVNV